MALQNHNPYEIGKVVLFLKNFLNFYYPHEFFELLGNVCHMMQLANQNLRIFFY